MAARNLIPLKALASSISNLVSLVYLQKLILWEWSAAASIRILAPAQNVPSKPLVITTHFTFG